MTAGITDLFTKASNGTAPVATTLASQKSNGATTASISLATGWPTTTAVHGLLYKVDANNAYVAGSLLVFKATLSGTTLSAFTVKSGTDDVYAAGSVIELAPTSAWADDIVTGILVGHNQDGSHIASLPLTTPQITTSLKDANGNTMVGFTPTGSAVNNMVVVNAASGNDPYITTAGAATNPNLNIRGKGTGHLTLGTAALSAFPGDFVNSGCVWTADAAGSTLNGSMSSGTVVIGGNPVTVAAVTAHAFTASKDTYVDLTDNGDGTAAIAYNAVTNAAAAPALAAGAIRIAKVVTGAGNIAAASSIVQIGKDSLGNWVYSNVSSPQPMVKARQGSTTGDGAWNLPGTSNTDVSAKKVFMQAGKVDIGAAAATTTVTFPVAFSQPPLVFLAPGGSSGATQNWYLVDGSETTTQFQIRQNASVATKMNWIAIGQ